MNQIALFRGKRVDNGEWVYGYYVRCRKHDYILPIFDDNPSLGFDERYNEWVRVTPETVGQYTRLNDKNGVSIFEGEVLIHTWANKDGTIRSDILTVEYQQGTYWANTGGACAASVGYYVTLSAGNSVEVIGNVHDNPELIGRK